MVSVIGILTILVQLITPRASREALIALYLAIRIPKTCVVHDRAADSPSSGVVCILHNRFSTWCEADGHGVLSWKTWPCSGYTIHVSRKLKSGPFWM